MTDRRFIEESFPVKGVGVQAAKDKYMRQGHINTLHPWWARRPLAASRATAFAALVAPAEDELGWQRRSDFIVELSKWENSLNRPLLDKARRDILDAHARRLSVERGEPVTVEDIEAGRAPRPRVLDPFGGGGSIPLEALRLGCETHASDYNPVAVLLLKAILEYPQAYGRAVPQQELASFFGDTVTRTHEVNPLLDAVRNWGDWVLEEARKDVARYYPPDPDGSVPVGYIWARAIPCQNPACGREIPLMRQFLLANSAQKKVAIRPSISDGQLTFHIVGHGYAPWPPGFDATAGTVRGAVATCPACGSVVGDDTVRRLVQSGSARQRMMVVVLAPRSAGGKTYRVPSPDDERVFGEASSALEAERDKLLLSWGIEPVPDEIIHTPDGQEYRPGGLLYNFTPVVLYGMTQWGHLFNTRQQLALVTLTDKVRRAHERMIREGASPDFAAAVATYLGIALSRFANRMTQLTYWYIPGEKIQPTFVRQALAMVWDSVEVNPFSQASGSWTSNFSDMICVVEHLSSIEAVPGRVEHTSATRLPYPDGFFDAVLTDPPYYDNVPYADLSDFFYVWLKRSIGGLHPALFTTPLTPKTLEAIAETPLLRGMSKAKATEQLAGLKSAEHFEHVLGQGFREVHRVLKPGGISVFVYAHKSTTGWETIINALLDSGLVVTGAWPLRTEMQSRLRAGESAALASSIYIVARKMARQGTGFYSQVQVELRRHLDTKLQRLWEEGISGADFFIASIGSAIEVFGRYEQVIDFEGNAVRADRLLHEVRTIATDYAVRQILRDGFAGEVSDLTRFYVLWRWEYGEALVPFDEARKLAQSCGLDLSREWGRGGFVRKEKEFVRALGPQRRDLDSLEDSHELIDVLHRVLLLWEKGRRADIVQALSFTGFGQSEAFYRVAQAVSETLPNESKEKKLLDGFLAGRARVREEVGKALQQRRLFE